MAGILDAPVGGDDNSGVLGLLKKQKKGGKDESSSKLPLEEYRLVLEAMREKFFEFDIDGQGEISCDEFRQVLEEMVGEPCPEDDWIEFIPKIDSDNSGTISFSEFLHALYHWFADDDAEEKEAEKDETDMVFKELKQHYVEARTEANSKFLTRQLLTDLLRRIAPAECTAESMATVFARLDPESSGPDTEHYSFADFLFGIYLVLLPEDEDSDNDDDDEGFGSHGTNAGFSLASSSSYNLKVDDF